MIKAAPGTTIKNVRTGGYVTVDWIVIKNLSEGNIQNDRPVYEPVVVKPDLLLKNHFNKGERRGFEAFIINERGAVSIAIAFLHDSVRIYLNGIYFEVDCLYLHRLQNLYFSLTGEELIINL